MLGPIGRAATPRYHFSFVLAVRSKGCDVASVPTGEALGCGREDA
jgi:hypothetical protein